MGSEMCIRDRCKPCLFPKSNELILTLTLALFNWHAPLVEWCRGRKIKIGVPGSIPVCTSLNQFTSELTRMGISTNVMPRRCSFRRSLGTLLVYPCSGRKVARKLSGVRPIRRSTMIMRLRPATNKSPCIVAVRRCSATTTRQSGPTSSDLPSCEYARYCPQFFCSGLVLCITSVFSAG